MTDNPTQPAHSEQKSDDRAVGDAIRILDGHRIMAISTVRPDGWPQTTIVGYANVGLTIYFMILRSSQKFANLARDDRASLAVGEEPRDVREAKAVYAGANVIEVTGQADREGAWKLLQSRHPNLADYELPDSSQAVLMRLTCAHVSVVDYTKGIGHTEAFTA